MDQDRNLYKYIVGALMLIYIYSIFALNVIIPNKAFSESENRVLEQKPEFSIRKVLKGRYTLDYEKYISDQFPFREFFIGVKSDCERLMGKQENNGVYLGKNGYLMEEFKKPKLEEFKRKIENINSFADSNLNTNTNIYFMLVPNSVKILEQQLPLFAPVDDEFVYINKVKDSLHKNIKFVDIYNILNSKKDEYIYYKTDHHWTTKSAFYAYEELAKYMKFTPYLESDFHIKRVTDNFYGSLYSKSGFRHLSPDSIDIYIPKRNEDYIVKFYDKKKTSNSIYEMDNLNKKDKYTIFFGGNHPLIKINKNISNGRKLLVIKDSYANNLIPFLMGHFNEIYVMDLRYYNDNLSGFLKKQEIDDILILYNEKSFFEEESINKISW
ncbi:hypothetical protein KQI42_07175 [Tissierella sp. MSJ-40]|uniref:DHHW protein n=1 Tax=Tissierella simiarum TaxID=2841534 RepID=A0ABS6E6C4_9FIRM|nr:DHHW family protein [Tissierella simiarum]MBU5437783.1 hypothetical protein [Tissierella simiarum]